MAVAEAVYVESLIDCSLCMSFALCLQHTNSDANTNADPCLPVVFSFAVVAVATPITVLYFWSFVIIAYFVLFNMVLAVIFTVYDEEYDELKKEMKREEKEEKKIAALMGKSKKKTDE